MKRVSAMQKTLRGVCGAVLLLACLPAARGAEPAREFLEALRQADYFDTAIEYLDQLASSSLTPASLREVLAYERAVTLNMGAKHQRDAALREKQYDEAQTALNEFIAQQPDHLLTMSAKSQLGTVLAERGNFRLERAKRPSEAQNRDKLRAEARDMYQQAYKTFQDLENDLKAKLQGAPPKLDEKSKEADRITQMRKDYMMVQLMKSATLEDVASAYPPESKEYKESLTAAAKAYGDVFTKYRAFNGGNYARMYQGRSFQKMGNFKEALGYYNELLEQPDEPQEWHELRTQVILLACDCWMDDSQKKYAEVIEKGGKWIEKAYPSEMRTPDFMKLRMIVARASRAYSDQIRKEKPKDPLVNGLLVDARKLAQYVSKFPSDYQKDALKLLAEIGGGATTKAADQPLPKNFEEARKAGREAIDAVEIAKTNIKNLQEQLKTEKDAEAKKKLQQELAGAEEAVKNGHADALRLFELAQQLVDKETTAEDLSLVRYFLCYVNYSVQNFDEAAVLGEFVAQRYPETGAARPCGRLAMYSYLKMYSDAKLAAQPKIDVLLADFDQDKDGRLSATELEQVPEDRRAELANADVDKNGKVDQAELIRIATRFESQRVVDICNYLTKQWPDQPESQEALGNLIQFMIGEQELDKAQDYLSKIPEDSPQRGIGELKLGQAIWSAYVYGMNTVRERKQAAAAGAVPPEVLAREAELKAYRDRAQKTLVDGVARMEKAGQVNVTFATASLALAQLLVDTDQAAKAVEVMEKPKVGPLALVQAKDEAVIKPGLAEEAYKTALRCYVSALASAASDATAAEALIKKAEGAMDLLKATVGDGDDAQKRLFVIYVSLARDLEQQMKLASDETKKNLGKGFETFLIQVRTTAKTLSELYWVATTFYSMGESYGLTQAGEVPADAKRFFVESAKTYEDILARGKQGTLQLDAQMTGQISLALAKTRREMGDYEASIKLFIQILEKTPMLLSIQVEAAKTYEAWAERSGDTKYYVHAIQGSMDSKTSRSKIWGWNEIARITAGKPEFRDAFYDARYHVSLSRYKFALAQKDPAKKKKELENAEKALASTYQSYPNLDGNPAENKKSFRESYEALARAIQKLLGKKEAGIAAYEIKVPVAPGPAAGATGKASSPTTGGPPPASGGAANAPATTTPTSTTK